MDINTSNSKNGQSKDAPAKNKKESKNKELFSFTNIFRFVIRTYIKIIKYTVLAFIEIFKELLTLTTGKKTKKS